MLGEYLGSEYDVAKYCYRLLDAELFQGNQDYVRRQFLYCLLQVCAGIDDIWKMTYGTKLRFGPG